jgi:hypothetical protein
MKALCQLVLLAMLVFAAGCGSRTVRRDLDAGVSEDVLFREDVFVFDRVEVPRDVVFPRDLVSPFDLISPRDVFLPPDLVLPPDRPLIVPDGARSQGLSCIEPFEVRGSAPSDFLVDVTRATMRRAGCSTTSLVGGAVQYFRTVVSPGQTLVVTGSSARPPFPLIRVLDSCEAFACVAQSTLMGGSPVTATARYTNTTLSTQPIVFAVGPSDTTVTSEPIAVSVRFVEPATNGRCVGAMSLTPDVTVTGQNTMSASEIPGSCPPVVATTQPALWYRVSVPPGQFLTVTLQGTGATFGGVQGRIYAGCGAACLPSTIAPGPDSQSLLLRWNNTNTTPRDAFIAVNSLGIAVPFAFDITARLSEAPANASCARATPVMEGSTLIGQDPSLSTTTSITCPGMPAIGNTNTLYYAADVPPGQALTATASQSALGRGSYVIRVLPACDEPVCLAASTLTGGAASTTWSNTGTATRRVIISVSPTAATAAFPFDLSVRVRTPPANVTCTSATRVALGTTVRGERLDFAREPNATCLAFGVASQPVLYYVVRVGAGERMIASVPRATAPTFAPVVRIIDGCTASMCLASSMSMPSVDNRATYTNPSMMPQDVIVMVSAASPATNAVFDLVIAGGTPPYRAEAIPGNCDVLTSPTTIASLVGDDVGAPSIPLPFAMRYFREPVLSWSASSNGYLQLWATSGMSTGALGASELPTSGAPPSMIAPFWDDLEIDAGTASVRWQDVAVGSRHLTIEWNNLRFCCGGGGGTDRLTFQAKLFAASNVIEFHYCNLSPSTRASGQNASVGIQDSAGVTGVSWAIRRAGALTTASGVRFTPTL